MYPLITYNWHCIPKYSDSAQQCKVIRGGFYDSYHLQYIKLFFLCCCTGIFLVQGCLRIRKEPKNHPSPTGMRIPSSQWKKMEKPCEITHLDHLRSLDQREKMWVRHPVVSYRRQSTKFCSFTISCRLTQADWRPMTIFIVRTMGIYSGYHGYGILATIWCLESSWKFGNERLIPVHCKSHDTWEKWFEF